MKARAQCITLALLATLLAAAGCAHLDYMGETYSPTSHVDIYYSEANVPREWTAMGEAIVTGDQLVSGDKMQEKLRREAMKRGADAVILESMEAYKAGESTSWSQHETEKTDKHGRTHTHTEGTASTSDNDKKRMHALFVRYKPIERGEARDRGGDKDHDRDHDGH